MSFTPCTFYDIRTKISIAAIIIEMQCNNATLPFHVLGWVGDEPGSPCSPGPGGGGGTQFNKAGATGSGGRRHFGGDPVPPPVKPRLQVANAIIEGF